MSNDGVDKDVCQTQQYYAAFYSTAHQHGGVFWQRREAQALELVADRNKELNLQLRGGLEVAETLVIAQAERDSLQAQWHARPRNC